MQTKFYTKCSMIFDKVSHIFFCNKSACQYCNAAHNKCAALQYATLHTIN